MISKNKMMPCNKTNLIWEGFSTTEWEGYYCSIKRANLLQSSPYALACAKTNYQTIRQGLFLIENKPAAILQILEAGFLKKAVHGIILDRGPLWLEGFGSADDFALFLEDFRQEFPARLGRKIRIIPEIENTITNQNHLKTHSFRPKDTGNYKTIWMDLRPDTEILKKNLNKKWRNALNKSKKQKIKIITEQNSHLLSWFLVHYSQDKTQKSYQGASLKLLDAIIGEFSRGKNALTLYALFDETPIAAILLFIHGNSATYQIGYTSQIGREKCAHNALLWHALEVLKERNVHDFDLGGIIEGEEGLTRFKKGMGGKTYETPGLFIG